MADLPPFAVAPAQQVGHRLAVLAVLGMILAHHTSYMDSVTLPGHLTIISHLPMHVKYYLGYIFGHHMTNVPAQLLNQGGIQR